MSSDDIAIRVTNISKCYEIYDNPRDRLKQFIIPRLNRFVGLISKHYFREFWALKDVSFEVKKGESVGIIGRNGSGKSTLLQIICGTSHPTSGTVESTGRIAALLELGSGFNPEFTGRENIYMNAAILGLDKKEIDVKFDDIVAFADVGYFIEQPVKTYSSGMVVRLAFSVIAHVDADILIIDEALAVGDAFFTQKCMRFLRAFMETGTVLFVSHDTGAIKNFCSSVVWLEKGVAIQEGSPKEVCEIYLQAFYEEQQGKTSKVKIKTEISHATALPKKDQRMAFINASNLRNDLKVFQFNPESTSFGNGGAHITNVEFLDNDGSTLGWVIGGEKITLRINVIANGVLESPIIGFAIKDRLGQVLFGENTYLSYMDTPVSCEIDDKIQAEFTFFMPILPPGEYSINAAIATGTQNQHIQHHWLHDAVLFKSESSSASTGLVGIPMLQIKLNTKKHTN